MSQTSFTIPPAGIRPRAAVAVTAGTNVRQWMLPQGKMLNEVGSSGSSSYRPVVQVCG